MKKIKDELVKKIYKSNLTQDELLFLIYILQISNSNGIANIYYKDISIIINCSISNFYNVVYSLKNKGFIEYNKCNECKQEITIKILHNVFNTKIKYKNYLDLNAKIFDIELLKTLKAKTIKTLLYLVFRTSKQKNIIYKSNELKYKNINAICESLNISKRTLKMYLIELENANILNISVKQDKNNNNFMLLTISSELLAKPVIEVTEKMKKTVKTESSVHRYYINIIKNLCRRKKIKYNQLNLDDTAILMNQYWKIAISNNKDIVNIIYVVFNNLKDELNSIVVHKIIKSLIKNNFNNKLIVY